MNYSALIGNPTDHSVSYLLFEELAKAAGLPGFYQHIRVNVAPDEVEASLEAFNALHFVGLNVTLPYKLDVLKYLDRLDAVVKELGAVNTIKLGDTLIGYNTDWMGIVESVRQFGGSAPHHTAIIFGTGGASRAAIYACKQLGVENIHVLYRFEESDNTQKLQRDSHLLGISLHPYAEARGLITDSQLVINATSAGMVGKAASPFELTAIKDLSLSDKVFLDAVFNPVHTPLLKHFAANGAVAIDGLWMMIYQGVSALGIWFDREIQLDRNDLQRIHDLMEMELQHV